MEISDAGTILSVRRFGERSAILCVLTEAHGTLSGLVKSATSPAQRGVLQVGNAVQLRWQARLAEQLGILHVELTLPRAAHLMTDALGLALLTSAASLIETYTVEREPHPQLANALGHMLEAACMDPLVGLLHYTRLELQLLRECGFGLDLRQCAVSGAVEGLSHVSPRTGRAVCAQVAAPYAGKLLRLPCFLREENPQISAENLPDMVDALALTGYFLNHWLVEATGRPLPAARLRLPGLVAATAHPLPAAPPLRTPQPHYA